MRQSLAAQCKRKQWTPSAYKIKDTDEESEKASVDEPITSIELHKPSVSRNLRQLNALHNLLWMQVLR
jgi:hypothetical protein